MQLEIYKRRFEVEDKFQPPLSDGEWGVWQEIKDAEQDFAERLQEMTFNEVYDEEVTGKAFTRR